MSAPKWATDLVAQVVDDEGLSFVPELRWRRSRRWPYHYHGNAYTTRCYIRITMGVRVSRWMQKLVVLHEMAHFLGGVKHNALFWDVAWDLYRRYDLPLRMTLKSEGRYRKGAVAGYRRNVAKQKGGRRRIGSSPSMNRIHP